MVISCQAGIGVCFSRMPYLFLARRHNALAIATFLILLAPSASNRLASVSGTSDPVTGLTASTTYYFVVRAADQAGESGNSNQAMAQTSGTGSASCHVTYTVYSQWPGGFNVGISIQNTGGTAINGWSLTWTWASTQQLNGVWNATGTQQGQNVTFVNASWNPTIAPGALLNGIGFNGAFSSANPSPSAFFVNGVACH